MSCSGRRPDQKGKVMRFSTRSLVVARTRGVAAVAVAALALAVAASPGLAATTIGSDMTVSEGTLGCFGSCTGVQTVIPGRTTASPVTGVIVRWRVGDGFGQLRLRGARPAPAYPGDDTYTGAGRSELVTVTTTPSGGSGAPPVISTFPTRLPVRAGDRIGVGLEGEAAFGFRDRAGAEAVIFFPALGEGQRRSA